MARKLALGLASICLFCAVIELGLRMFPAAEPPALREARAFWRQGNRTIAFYDRLLRAHPELGYALPEDAADTLTTEEYVMPVQIRRLAPNLGVRDEVRPAEVFFIGDSFCFGAGVDERDRVSEVFESLTGRSTLNLGVPGYGAAQAGRLFRLAVPTGRPRLLVHLIFFNDPFDDETFMNAPSRRPYRLPDRFRMWLREESRLYVLAGLVSDRLRGAATARAAFRQGGRVRSVRMESRFARPASLDAFGDAIRNIAKLCEETGIRYAPVLIPPSEFIVLHLIPEQQLMYEGYLRFAAALKDRVSLDADVLDPLAVFQETALPGADPLYFETDKHLTPAGHRALAEFLSRRLASLNPAPP